MKDLSQRLIQEEGTSTFFELQARSAMPGPLYAAYKELKNSLLSPFKNDLSLQYFMERATFLVDHKEEVPTEFRERYVADVKALIMEAQTVIGVTKPPSTQGAWQ